MNNFIHKLDILSPRIELTYHSRHKHSSIFSGFLSMLVIAIFASFTVYSINELFEKTYPFSYTTTRYQKDFGLVRMDQKEMFMIFRITDFDDSSKQFDETFFQMNGYLITYDDNGLNRLFRYEFDKCNWDVDGNGLEGIYNKEKFKEYYCIRKAIDLKTNQTSVKKNKDDNFPYPYISLGVDEKENMGKYRMFNFELSECQNTTSFNRCKPRETIHKFFNQTGYDFAFVDNNIEVSNYLNPIVRYPLIENGRLGAGQHVTNHFNIFPSTLISSDNLLFDIPAYTPSYKQLYNEKSQDQNEEGDVSVLTCYFWPKNQGTFYVRKYKRLQDICASVGGFLNFVLQLSLLINFLPNKFQILNDSSHIFDKNKFVRKIDKKDKNFSSKKIF